MSRKTISVGPAVIVYDDDLISQIDTTLFEPDRWPEAEIAGGPGAGRGKVLMIEVEGRRLALRHYYRGGLARYLSADRYLWTGPDRSRPFREWSLLAHLFAIGLPVPRPVAARAVRHGLFYTADLLTQCLADVESLSQRLSTTELSAESWASIGRLIARFHAEHICHADLNAHNIQIDPQGNGYLLDFDRGRIMNGPGSWSTDNLNRLQRSFKKLQHQELIHFNERHWQSLLDGYHASMAAHEK